MKLSRIRRSPQSASAMVVVLVALTLVSLFSLATVRVVVSLQRELRRVEQKQMQKFQAQPVHAPGTGEKAAGPVGG